MFIRFLRSINISITLLTFSTGVQRTPEFLVGSVSDLEMRVGLNTREVVQLRTIMHRAFDEFHLWVTTVDVHRLYLLTSNCSRPSRALRFILEGDLFLLFGGLLGLWVVGSSLLAYETSPFQFGTTLTQVFDVDGVQKSLLIHFVFLGFRTSGLRVLALIMEGLMAKPNAEGGAFWAYTYSTEPSKQTTNNHQIILLFGLLLEFLGFFAIGPRNLRLLNLNLRLINYDNRSIYICLCDGLKPPTGSIHIVDPIGGLLSVERVEALIEGHSVEQLCDVVLIIGIESLLGDFGFNQLVDAFYQLQDELPLTFRVGCY